METCGLCLKLRSEYFTCSGCPFMIKGEKCVVSDKIRRKIGCPIREESGMVVSKANEEVTIDKCIIGQGYWLDDCMDESGIYVGNGRWLPTIRRSYGLYCSGLICLDGGYFYPKNNSVKAESGNKMRIHIPTGYTAKIENNTVIFEPKTVRFKKGDFVESMDDIHVVSDIIEDKLFFDIIYSSVSKTVNTKHRDWGIIDNFRLASDSEKQLLLDKLHESGKDWDAEKCEIVDWVWEPKSGDSIWSINGRGEIFEWTFLGTGEYLPQTVDFRTPELAESALELLKQAKHY